MRQRFKPSTDLREAHELRFGVPVAGSWGLPFVEAGSEHNPNTASGLGLLLLFVLAVQSNDHLRAAQLIPQHNYRDAMLVDLRDMAPSEGADWRYEDAGYDVAAGRLRFRLRHGGTVVASPTLRLTGLHNVANATGAAAALVAAGCTADEVTAGFAAFGGVGRRLETVAEARGVLVLDDYGHHPADIAATVRGLRARFPGRRLVVVFQPHQASRTRLLLDDFAAALALADVALLAPIYAARDSEEDRRAVSSGDVAARVEARGGHATALESLAAVEAHAASIARPGDVVVTMGAGDVDEVARGLGRRLR